MENMLNKNVIVHMGESEVRGKLLDFAKDSKTVTIETDGYYCVCIDIDNIELQDTGERKLVIYKNGTYLWTVTFLDEHNKQLNSPIDGERTILFQAVRSDGVRREAKFRVARGEWIKIDGDIPEHVINGIRDLNASYLK